MAALSLSRRSNWPSATPAELTVSRHGCPGYSNIPRVICELALREIRYELENDVAERDIFYLLHDISWSGQWLWNAIAPPLLRMVEHREPENLNNLRQALTVLQGSSLADGALAQQAAHNANTA